MKKLLMGAALLTAAGCNNVEVGLLPIGLTTPTLDETTQSCTFDPGGESLLDVRVDVNTQRVLRLDVATRNILSAEDTVLQLAAPREFIPHPNTLSPVRFDYRWECDSNGFSADLGPLVLPAFSGDVTRPFCLDSRDEATKNFVGFDVVSATGSALAAGATGFITARPMTAQLGQAMSDFFEISERAEQCCRDVRGCDNLPTMAQSAPACVALQAIFDRIAGAGVLDTRKVNDVQRFRPFAAFTPVGFTAASRPAYYMRLRGTFEAVNATGDLYTSGEYTTDVGFCRGGPGVGCGSSLVQSCRAN
jgi:hypothetical protein